MKKNSHIIFLIFSILGIVLSIGIFLYGINLIRNTTKKTSDILTKTEEIVKKNSELSTIKKTISATEEDRAKLLTYFVTDKGIVAFLEYLESLGEITNTDASIRAVDLDKDGNFVTVSISSTGSYSNLVRFSKLIENMPYRIEVQNFAFVARESLAEDGSDISNWEVNITIKLISYMQS